MFTLHPAKLNFVLRPKIREWNWEYIRVCLPENRWRSRKLPGVVAKRGADSNPFDPKFGHQPIQKLHPIRKRMEKEKKNLYIYVEFQIPVRLHLDRSIFASSIHHQNKKKTSI